MKIIFTLIASLFILFSVNSQTINDTIFNEVFVIKNENIIKKDNNFFINIPIKTQTKPIIIATSEFNITAKKICNRKILLPEQNEFILITPDWEFIKELLEEQKREGIHIKAEKHKFYHIKRSTFDCKIDSLSRSIYDVRNPIILNYKDLSSKKDTKIIRGFVFEEHMIPAQMEVSLKGTNVKTQTDGDGKFTIEAKEGDIILISSFGERTIEITVTEKNCYEAYLFRDTGLIYRTKKGYKERNKTRQKTIRKFKQGFYNCND